MERVFLAKGGSAATGSEGRSVALNRSIKVLTGLRPIRRHLLRTVSGLHQRGSIPVRRVPTRTHLRVRSWTCRRARQHGYRVVRA